MLIFIIVTLNSCIPLDGGGGRAHNSLCLDCESKNRLLKGMSKDYLDKNTNFTTKKAKINKYHGAKEWDFVGYFRDTNGLHYYQYYTGIEAYKNLNDGSEKSGGYERIDIYFSEVTKEIYYIYCSFYVVPTDDLQ